MDESSEGDLGGMSVTTAETTEGKGAAMLSGDEHSAPSQYTNDSRSYVSDAQDTRSYVSDAQDTRSYLSDVRSMSTDGQYSNDRSKASYSTGSYSTRTGSEAGRYSAAHDDDASSSSSRSTGSGSSRSRGSSGSSQESDVSGMSQDSLSLGGDAKASPELADAIDPSDWRAVGEAAAQLTGGESTNSTLLRSETDMSDESDDMLDNMIDEGNWSGIIDAASNMTSGHVPMKSDVDSIDSID